MPAVYNPASRLKGRMQSLSISGNFLGPVVGIAPAILSQMLNEKKPLPDATAKNIGETLDLIQRLAWAAKPLPLNFHPEYADRFKAILNKFRRGLFDVEIKTLEDFPPSIGFRVLAGLPIYEQSSEQVETQITA